MTGILLVSARFYPIIGTGDYNRLSLQWLRSGDNQCESERFHKERFGTSFESNGIKGDLENHKISNRRYFAPNDQLKRHTRTLRLRILPFLADRSRHCGLKGNAVSFCMIPTMSESLPSRIYYIVHREYELYADLEHESGNDDFTGVLLVGSKANRESKTQKVDNRI